MKILNRFLIFFGIIFFTISLLGNYTWYFDVFSHFRIYFVGYFLVCFCFSFFSEKKHETIISGVFFLFTLLSISPFYFGKNKTNAKEGLKIGAINLLSSNTDFSAVTKFIHEENFDVLLLQELTPDWERQLDSTLSGFSTKIYEAREDNFGMGMLIKSNPLLLEVMNIGQAEIPSIIAKMRHENLVIIGTHPLPPVGSEYFDLRNGQFNEINSLVKSIGSEVVVIGDLNSSSYSPNFKKITEGTTLRDSRIGFGLQPSWNALYSWLAVPIDHALVTEGIEVIDRRLGPNIGSDHHPIIIEIAVN